MAKQYGSYMGGFSGRLGPAVGYMWNGKWCLRSRPAIVRNPRTERQMEQRGLFGDEVRLAARMRWVLQRTLTEPARAAGMTAYNLFVSLNQPAFSLLDGQLAVDYASLTVSVGPAAPVQLGTPTVDADGRLAVTFERNPLHAVANNYDEVRLYLFCPSLDEGYLTAPVYRREQAISALLPSHFVGRELHLYAFVTDRKGHCSASAYAHFDPDGTEVPSADAEALPAAEGTRVQTTDIYEDMMGGQEGAPLRASQPRDIPKDKHL